MQNISVKYYIISSSLVYYKQNSGGISIREDDASILKDDIKYLEKAFKKWTPNMLSSPYIPTPSVLIKGPQELDNTKNKKKRPKIKPTTKPGKFDSKERYEEIIDCLHKGAMAYSVGDYGTAINHFTRLLGNEWLKNATYFYLVKTLIKLDIEKEILSLRSKPQTNKVEVKESKKKSTNEY
jgi:hypothetical protein